VLCSHPQWRRRFDASCTTAQCRCPEWSIIATSLHGQCRCPEWSIIATSLHGQCRCPEWSIIATSLHGRDCWEVRKRWLYKLDPERSTAPWCEEEDAALIQQHALHSDKWSIIAKSLHGRNRRLRRPVSLAPQARPQRDEARQKRRECECARSAALEYVRGRSDASVSALLRAARGEIIDPRHFIDEVEPTIGLA
jgi:hypothetical protein